MTKGRDREREDGRKRGERGRGKKSWKVGDKRGEGEERERGREIGRGEETKGRDRGIDGGEERGL